jgi:hypothetical protein
MRLTHEDAALFKAAIRVEYNDRNATPMRGCDYIAWVDGMERSSPPRGGRQRKPARGWRSGSTRLLRRAAARR